MTRCFLLASALAVLGAGGCSNQPKTGTATGKVTFDAKPLPGAVVSFVSKDGGTPATAMTDAAGAYSAASVPAGEVLVSVSVPSANSAETGEIIKKMGSGENKKGPSGPPPAPIKLPPRYADPGTSGLKTTIKPDAEGPTTYDIPLTR